MEEHVRRPRTLLQLKNAFWELDEHCLGVTFGHRPSYLRLAVLCRPFPDAEDDSDRDVLLAAVTIDQGTYQGGFEMHTSSTELAHLRRLLQELAQRADRPTDASFRFVEAVLHLRVQSSRHGFMTMDVEARDQSYEEPALQYSIGFAQSDLRDWIEALDVILEVFPPAFELSLSSDPLHY